MTWDHLFDLTEIIDDRIQLAWGGLHGWPSFVIRRRLPEHYKALGNARTAFSEARRALWSENGEDREIEDYSAKCDLDVGPFIGAAVGLEKAIASAAVALERAHIPKTESGNRPAQQERAR